MTQDITTQEAIKRLEQHFGSREGMLTHNHTMLSSSGQPADITFYRRKPLINVQISTKIAAARLYGLEDQLPNTETHTVLEWCGRQSCRDLDC